MGKRKVDRLTIGEGSSLAFYDRSESSADLFFEETSELDVFKVVLVEGTYGHTGQEVEQGKFEANMSTGGSLHGYVISSLQDRTPEGQPASISLMLKAEI